MNDTKNRIVEHLLLDLEQRNVTEQQERIQKQLQNYYDNRQYNNTDNRKYTISITIGSYNTSSGPGVLPYLVIFGICAYMFIQLKDSMMLLF